MAYLTFNRAADSSLFVSQSLDQYKDKVQDRLVREWSDQLDTLPLQADVLLQFMARDLSQARETMLKSLNQFLTGSGSTAVPREERLEAVRYLRNRYQYIRDHCVNTYGIAIARSMGFDLVTEDHPWRLARQAERVLDKFGELDPGQVILPEDEWKRANAVSPGNVIEVLEKPHVTLVEVLEKLLAETKDTEMAFLRKEEDYQAFQRKLNRYAEMGAALFRLAGMDAEAERIKPSVRRSGQREVLTVEVPDAAGSPAEPGSAPPQDSAEPSAPPPPAPDAS